MSVTRAADEALRRIRRDISVQVGRMAQLATDQACRACLHTIAEFADKRITELTRIVRRRKIRPFAEVRLSESLPPAPLAVNTLRVGVYPLAANPFHWGHLLVGLTALVLLELDKVIFVVAGSDSRKPALLPEEQRHRLARALIGIFEPFFAYSPIARGTDHDGETNLGRLLALNPLVCLHAFYVAGFDHYRRRNELGEPDTIEKLERLAQDLSRSGAPRHSLSVAFVDRKGEGADPAGADTFLDVHVLPAIPFICSSTAARHALCRDVCNDAVMCVPYQAFAEIRSHGLYEGERGCVEEQESS